MQPLLVDAPQAEPITLAQAKIWLRVDTSDEDDLIATILTAARMIVEAESGRKLINQNWRLILDAWPADGILKIPLRPVQSVASIRMFDSASQPFIVAAASYFADINTEAARIVAGAGFPQPGRTVSGIEVNVTVGYGPAAANVPEPLRQAMLLLIARWYEARGDMNLRIDQGLPPEIAPLVAPYRKRRV